MVIAVPKVVLDTKIIPLTPVGQPGTPEEIARRVDFLAADRREITDLGRRRDHGSWKRAPA
jgi:NAD(P)-dependent dehydrogenase (short-subunit alcohol dehydrogenase family)